MFACDAISSVSEWGKCREEGEGDSEDDVKYVEGEANVEDDANVLANQGGNMEEVEEVEEVGVQGLDDALLLAELEEGANEGMWIDGDKELLVVGELSGATGTPSIFDFFRAIYEGEGGTQSKVSSEIVNQKHTPCSSVENWSFPPSNFSIL